VLTGTVSNQSAVKSAISSDSSNVSRRTLIQNKCQCQFLKMGRNYKSREIKSRTQWINIPRYWLLVPCLHSNRASWQTRHCSNFAAVSYASVFACSSMLELTAANCGKANQEHSTGNGQHLLPHVQMWQVPLVSHESISGPLDQALPIANSQTFFRTTLDPVRRPPVLWRSTQKSTI